MKIDYEASLYKKIANLEINKFVQVTNRNGVKRTIHIQNITKLKWPELQLLTQNGADSFSKMVFLYQQYSNPNNTKLPLINGNSFSITESDEINRYIQIYHSNKFIEHYQVNKFISENNLWHQFPTIRSLNNHGPHKEIEGIEPKYFTVICEILKISGGNGLPLDSYKKY